MRPLAAALSATADAIQPCGECGNWDAVSPCGICTDVGRDTGVLCVVEDVADLWAIERGHSFKGRYHVLGGTLSALDVRGPDQLNVSSLVARVKGGPGKEAVREVILATNATVAGQTTAHYICELLAETGARLTRLAQGVPLGGELDYLDEGTLTAALQARLPV